MANCAMLVCSFYLKKRYSKEDSKIYNLNHELESNNKDKPFVFKDFWSILELFCEENIVFSDREQAQKMFSVKKDSLTLEEKDTYRAASFVVQSGSYGIESDMTNRHTMEISHHRTEDEADVKSFRCVVYIPKDAGDIEINKGIFVFQSIGTYGVKTITTDIMRAFFADFGFTLEIRSVSVNAFLKKLIDQGALNKITLIRNRMSPNVADNILINTGSEEVSYIKPDLRPAWLKKILTIFEKADNEGIVEIPDDEDFDDLSIQFKLGNSTRTVRLKNLDKLSIVEDIPSEIIDKKTDLPLIRYMINTANAYKNNIIFRVSNEE